MSHPKDIKPTNDKGENHGYHEVYHHNGKLHYKCTYVNGKEVGYDVWYQKKSKTLIRYHII